MPVLVENAMSVGEAAHFLGVTEKQVQHLGRRGDVIYVARGLLDATSVRLLASVRQGQHTRGWSGRTAWAAVSLLSGSDAPWLGQGQLSRLRSRLREIDSVGLVAAARNRAHVVRFTGHEAAVRRLDREAGTVGRRVLPGLGGPSQDAGMDWYVDAGVVERLARAHGLRAATRGDFVLRCVDVDSEATGEGVSIDLVKDVMSRGDVLTALDAASSEDPRERGVALRILEKSLNRFRANG